MDQKLNKLAQKITNITQKKAYRNITSTFGSLLMFAIVISMTHLLVNTIFALFIDVSKFNSLIEIMLDFLPVMTLFLLFRKEEDWILLALALGTYLTVFKLDASNIPFAIIIAYLTSYTYRFIHYFVNKLSMGRSIPENVQSTLKLYLSYFITLILLFSIMNVQGFVQPFILLVRNIISFISHPIVYLSALVLSCLFWTIGAHGEQMMGPFVQPIIIFSMLQGLIIPSSTIINASFHVVFFSSTGSGITLGLILAIKLFSKDPNEKDIANSNILHSLFNINEGVLFGIPVVGNKAYKIPFLLAPIASVLYGYSMMALGIIQPFTHAVPWITPPLIKSFLASGGSISAVLVELGIYVISALIYSYFVITNSKRISRS